MDRTEYLNLCKRVSVLLPTIPKLLSRVPTDCIVVYDGIEYYPQGYQLSFDNGQTVHTAILHDLNAKSVMCCPLDKVNKRSIENDCIDYNTINYIGN